VWLKVLLLVEEELSSDYRMFVGVGLAVRSYKNGGPLVCDRF